MTNELEWLPPLVLFQDYASDWKVYCDALYEFFQKDFIQSKPRHSGKRFALKRHPEYDGKAATFWHLISEGDSEEERTPEMRRCERIRWPRSIIESQKATGIRTWNNSRHGKLRIVIALADFSYVVIIEDRKDFVLLWTAFPVTRDHQRKKFAKEYEMSIL